MEIKTLKQLIKTVLIEELSTVPQSKDNMNGNMDQTINHDNDPKIIQLTKKVELSNEKLAAERENRFKVDIRNLKMQIAHTSDLKAKTELRDRLKQLMSQLNTAKANRNASTNKIAQLK